MGIVISDELDPLFETGVLLYCSSKKFNAKDRIIAELNGLGINGEAFYQKHFSIIKRYLRYFKKNMVVIEGKEFFFNAQEDFFALALKILVENREWIDDFGGVSDLEVRSLIAFMLENRQSTRLPDKEKMPILEGSSEIIDFLQKQDITEEMKWHFMEFMSRPKYWLEVLFECISANIPAYEQAVYVVRRPYAEVLKRYRNYTEAHADDLQKRYGPDRVVSPTLIAPVQQMDTFTRGYHGMLNEFISRKDRNPDAIKDSLVMKMKALGDRSKLEILCTLKEQPKYNLELADSLKLSTSTVSHHMSVLFNCGLVSVQKKNAKVYYCVETEAIEEMAADLQHLLG